MPHDYLICMLGSHPLCYCSRPCGDVVYLVGHEAIDIARMTGIGLQSPRHGLEEVGDIDPAAIDAAITHGYRPAVFLDIERLSWWDRMRVAWARIGGYTWLEASDRHAY